jgi:cytochrome bd-type quinol oxidase subunit 2
MSDIGLLPAGADAFFAALLLVVVGALLALGAFLRAWLRSRRLSTSLRDDPATAYAGAGIATMILALALAVIASEAALETREALDVWWLACIAGVVVAAALAAWGVRRLRDPACPPAR